MLKKIISVLLTLALLLGAVTALAEKTSINPLENRNITIHKAGDNEVEEGVSPTTGRQLSEIDVPAGALGMAVDGRYRPILVQISNSGGGAGDRAPWNGSQADIVYETPLRADGETRMAFLFSDVQPDYVGPLRSLRMHHIKLRAEWDCPYLYAGSQKFHNTNVEDEISRQFPGLQADGKTPERYRYMYDGTANKAWNKYIYRCANFFAPHNSIGYLTGSGGTKEGEGGIIQNIYPDDVTPKVRPFKFSEELPEGGDEGEVIYVTHAKFDDTGMSYDSVLEYDEDENVYYRYMLMKDGSQVLYDEIVPTYVGREVKENKPVDRYELVHGEAITFSNVIIQFMDVHYWGTQSPDPFVTGTGNADYFMGGRHYKGVWNRDELTDRTVFYGEDGEEITLLPGKTLIVMMDLDYNTHDYMQNANGTRRDVSYE